MNDKRDLIGQKFGKLTVIDYLGFYAKNNTKTKRHYYKCKCDCGNEKIASKNALLIGDVKSCGCLQRGTKKGTVLKHKQNDFYIYNDIVFVKYSNNDKYFICDLDDWEKLKNYYWADNGNGYASSGIGYFHRIVTNCPANMEVDHIYQVSNGVCDNRKTNLRIVTKKENTFNKKSISKSKAEHKGIIYDTDREKWRVYISINGRYKYLGRFDSLDDAIEARRKAEIKYYNKKEGTI